VAERYVRPPLLGREAPSRWRTTWPFRVALLLLVALVVLAGVQLVQLLTGAAAQDPGVSLGGRHVTALLT